MSDVKRKIKLSGLLIASIISANFVLAGDANKNNVVDVKVNRESNSAVKVTIYTDKPYSEPIVVNKKANNKYVILMPETSSSMTAAPKLENLAGTVSNVSVNTQHVNGGKGYTKIVITSEKAISVVPRTQQLSAHKSTSTQDVNQQEQIKKLTELKAQQEKERKLAEQKAQQEKAKKDATLKAQQEHARKLAAQKAQQEKARKDAALKAQQEHARKLAAQKAQQEKAKKDAALKAQQEQERKLAEQKAQQEKAKVKEATHPIDVLEKEVQTSKDAELRKNSKNDAFLNQQISENSKKDNNNVKKDIPVDETQKLSVKQNVKEVLDNYHNISIWKLLLLSTAITFPLIVIFLILGLDKKLNKKILEKFAKNKDTDTTYPESEETGFAEYENKVVYEEPLEVSTSVYESIKEETLGNGEFVNDFESDDFTNDIVENTVNETEIDENVQTEPVEINETTENNAIEPTTVFDEGVEQDETVESIVQEEIAGTSDELVVIDDNSGEVAGNYEPDGFLSDFQNVDDKEFFDELIIKSMAEDNINGLPEQSPADAIFDTLTAVENDDIKEADSVISEEVGLTETNTDNDVEENIFDNVDLAAKVENIEEEPVWADISDNQQVDNEQNDDIQMLNEVALNDNTGLYLVNYEDSSSLVGHIGDEYFVLKKFDFELNAKVSVKRAEKVGDVVRYIVRVGKEKMIIEVSETSMSRLLDL